MFALIIISVYHDAKRNFLSSRQLPIPGYKSGSLVYRIIWDCGTDSRYLCIAYEIHASAVDLFDYRQLPQWEASLVPKRQRVANPNAVFDPQPWRFRGEDRKARFIFIHRYEYVPAAQSTNSIYSTNDVLSADADFRVWSAHSSKDASHSGCGCSTDAAYSVLSTGCLCGLYSLCINASGLSRILKPWRVQYSPLASR
ncbi:hypothetical protein BDZ97DRAFT_1063904 [Flammula alnicola]|nr:hypothetical protein BDZ97DRAFT_1063904 [Flammula alnicola]